LATSFLEKYLRIAARNRAIVLDCTYYIINLYTAGPAHLTNNDTRHAYSNSRHIKEPGEMSHNPRSYQPQVPASQLGAERSLGCVRCRQTQHVVISACCSSTAAAHCGV